MKENILVLGAGAWGTAIANLIAENTRRKVYLWAFENHLIDEINKNKFNDTYLPKLN